MGRDGGAERQRALGTSTIALEEEPWALDSPKAVACRSEEGGTPVVLSIGAPGAVQTRLTDGLYVFDIRL